MALTQAEFRLRVRAFARVTEKTAVSDDQLDYGIEQALCEYSLKLPKIVSVSLPSSTSGAYDLSALVAGWDNTQQVQSLVYLDSNGEPIQAASTDWTFFNLGAPTLKVLSASSIFSSLTGGAAFLRYYCPRAFDAGTSNFEKYDEAALVFLAAANACLQAAAECADEDNSSIAADVVDYGQQTSNWLSLYEKYLSKWKAHLACRRDSVIDEADGETLPGETNSFGGFATWECPPTSGTGRFFH